MCLSKNEEDASLFHGDYNAPFSRVSELLQKFTSVPLNSAITLHTILYKQLQRHDTKRLSSQLLRKGFHAPSSSLGSLVSQSSPPRGPRPTCRMKSWTMLCSDTWEPMAKRRLSCFSMRDSISWSSCVVKPSAPAGRHCVNSLCHPDVTLQDKVLISCVFHHTCIA